MRKKIYFVNIGCKVNFAELSRLKKMFIDKDYEVIKNAENADIVLINTCTVTNHSDSESRQIIRKIRKNNPNAFIGVLGCYAQLKPDEILENTGANAIFGINEKFNIPNIISDLANEYKNTIFVSEIDNTKFDFAYSADSEVRTRAFIKLQDGCNYRCTYCTIPLARGESRSIEFCEILPQIQQLVEANYKEIVISGINLSDYKSTTGENFLSLIEFISNLDLDVRFRISSIEPQIINEQLIEIITHSKNICPHFHIPLQSGSDAVLQAMKRRYNTVQFKENIELINKYLPEAFIGLDLISGFPGETVENFEETKSFIESLNISALHCFTYSKRTGTIAANMPNHIPKQEKKRRTNEMIKISNQKFELFVNKNIGRTFDFLPETYNQETSYCFGHTENYIGAYVKTAEKLPNKLFKIKLVNVVNSKGYCELI